jgi:hypothetical protein
MERKAVFAGRFYPLSASAIAEQIDSFINNKALKKEHLAKGLVLPHAGYIYSGQVAAETIASFNLNDTLIIIGPNHTGMGAEFAVSEADNWKTPFGDVEVNQDLASLLIENSNYLSFSEEAHTIEHSVEIQLPLLQYIKKDFNIVPICVSSDKTTAYEDIGKTIANTAKDNNIDVSIIASTDLTHYEPYESAKKKDKKAIDAILDIDMTRLLKEIKINNISMCGYAPVSIMIKALNAQGVLYSKLINYQTSADATGDYSQVVGYAGIGLY